MVRFDYEATNAAGQTVKSQVEAPSSEEAIKLIRTAGNFPMRVRATHQNPPVRANASRWMFFGSISVHAITNFTRQLSTLQDAGLPILRSLKVLAGQERPGPFKFAIHAVASDVESGETLAAAMARHPRAFDRLYVSMVQAGETGGILDIILQRLAEFMEKARKLKRRVTGAMIYPACVLSFSVLIVTGLMVFIIPKFKDIFKDFKTRLPWITEALINTSNWVAQKYGWLVILGLPFGLLLALKLAKKTDLGRLLLDRLKFRLPVFGKILRKTAIARFTRTLGTLLAAGVPILEALDITRNTAGNTVLERALRKVHQGIREGETFAAHLKASRICDDIVINMIDVGEETGDLDKMLMKIADNYDEEVDVLIGSLVSMLEPIMVIAMGLIVGTIVIALFLPLVAIMNDMTNGGG